MMLYEVFALFAAIFAIASFYSGSQIAKFLQSRGIDAKPMLIRFMIFKYMAQYKRITIEETGTVGPLYNRCASLLAVTGVLVVCMILAKVI